MHISLPIGDGQALMGSDRLPGMGSTTFGDSVAISVFPESSEEGRRIFDALSAGGQVTMPYERQFWGDDYGDVQGPLRHQLDGGLHAPGVTGPGPARAESDDRVEPPRPARPEPLRRDAVEAQTLLTPGPALTTSTADAGTPSSPRRAGRRPRWPAHRPARGDPQAQHARIVDAHDLVPTRREA